MFPNCSLWFAKIPAAAKTAVVCSRVRVNQVCLSLAGRWRTARPEIGPRATGTLAEDVALLAINLVHNEQMCLRS
jgi:hypothetical protein